MGPRPETLRSEGSAERLFTAAARILLHSLLTLSTSSVSARSASSGRGGVFLADANCSTVTVRNSSFDRNSAVAGAVGFLLGWTSRASPRVFPTCADCVVGANRATAWGQGVFSTDIASATLSATPDSLSSGGSLIANVSVFDGAIQHFS